jgi:hypothetical protein
MSEKGILLTGTKDSTPPGVLNADQIGRFKTTQEDIAELPIISIQPHRLIPDYRDPTESTLPIVVKSPTGFHCIDGWRLIQRAIAADQPAIRCFVIQIQEHSDKELAIRKVEVRTKPRGGTCLFAELVRNTSILAKIFEDKMENPIVFSHGGARRGENFSNNEEDDLRQMLSDRLGKDRNTINNYLHFARHLTDETMDALIAKKASKAFFENARVNKRILIKNMKSDEVEEREITSTVSNKMLEWLDEYSRTGKVISDYAENDDPEGDEQSISELPLVVGGSPENETFHHQTIVDTSDSLRPPTEEDVKVEIQAIILSLTAIMEQSPIEIDDGINTLNDQITKLAMIPQMLMDIRNHISSESDKEAA